MLDVDVRWVRLLVGVLIFFGIYTYRKLLFEGLVYSISLRQELIYATILVAGGFLLAGMRVKTITTKMGSQIGTGTAVKSFLVYISSVFSLIKMANLLSVYYLKKRGVFLSHAMVSFVVGVFVEVFVFLCFGVLLLGKFNWVSAGMLFVIGTTAALFMVYGDRLPDTGVFRKFKDFRADLGTIVTGRVGVVVFALTLGYVFVNALAISLLTGSDVAVATTAMVMGGLLIAASPVSGAIGIYEAAIPAYLVAQGIGNAAAVGGIMTYRLLSMWVPAIAGTYIVHKEL